MTAIATLETKLAGILNLEFTVAQGKRCLPLAVNRAQAAIGLAADRKRLYAAIGALSDGELEAYATYRRTNKWWDFN